MLLVTDNISLDECGCRTNLGCVEHGPQPRERAVTCIVCSERKTWNVDGICNAHERKLLFSDTEG